MDENQVADYWNKNADAWTKLSRAGYNTSRDLLNTPAFLEMLGPPFADQRGLDIGCGDGHLTRLLAQRGVRMTGLDIAPTFILHARDQESITPLGIDYVLASAQQLPFADASFDLVTGMMSFMDMPRPDLAIAESFRILKPDGVLQFAITHPCFQTAQWKWITDENGRRTGVICGDYFTPAPNRLDVWIFGSAPREIKKDLPKFRIPRFDFTLSWWVNTIRDAGFTLDRMLEPMPDDELIAAYPDFYDNKIVAFFLHFRCVKESSRGPGVRGQ